MPRLNLSRITPSIIIAPEVSKISYPETKKVSKKIIKKTEVIPETKEIVKPEESFFKKIINIIKMFIQKLILFIKGLLK